MNFPVLALFDRAIRVESRQRSTYVLRLGLVLCILVSLLFLHFSLSYIGAPGRDLFIAVMFINFFFITLIGLHYFASAITEEKETMTLGLLRMTSLNPVSILLGKSTSRLVGVVLLILAQLPFTLLAITLGGVGVNQIAAAYLTLISYVVFLVGLSLFASVIMSTTRKAGSLTMVLLMIFFFVPPFLSAILPDLVSLKILVKTGILYRFIEKGSQFFQNASAFQQLTIISKTGFNGPLVGFQIISNLLFGLFFFLLSWLSFNTFNRFQKKAKPFRGLLARKQSVLRFLGVGRTWKNALAWKDFHFVAGGRMSFCLKIVLLILITGIFSYFIYYEERNIQPSELKEKYAIFWMVIAVIGAALELAFHASRTFNEELRWNTLTSLKVLPKSNLKLITNKMTGAFVSMASWGIILLMGIFLSPEIFFEGVKGMFFTLPGLIYVLKYVFFIYLCLYVSFIAKRAPFGAAIGIMFLSEYFFLSIIFLLMYKKSYIAILILLLLIAGMNYAVLNRLRKTQRWKR